MPNLPTPQLGVSLTPHMAEAAGFKVLVTPAESAPRKFWTYQNGSHYIVTEGAALHEVMCLTTNKRVVQLIYAHLERQR